MARKYPRYPDLHTATSRVGTVFSRPMKRIAAAAAAAGAGLAVLIATPAQSIGSPSPAQGEFTMPAPTQALGNAKVASGQGGSGAVYEPVRAPATFTMLEFEWSGQGDPGIAVRVSPDGSDWGPWTTVPGAPDGGPDPGSRESSANARHHQRLRAGVGRRVPVRPVPACQHALRSAAPLREHRRAQREDRQVHARGFGDQTTGTGTCTTPPAQDHRVDRRPTRFRRTRTTTTAGADRRDRDEI